MYQIKIISTSQIDMLEELINMWLRENANVNVVDIKFNSNINNGLAEYVAIMIYQAA